MIVNCIAGIIYLLVFLGKKLLGPLHSKTIKWSDMESGKLKCLHFDRTGHRLAAVSDSFIHIIPFLQIVTVSLLTHSLSINLT